MYSIESQYREVMGEVGSDSDFEEMLEWMSRNDMKPCTDSVSGEYQNNFYVQKWKNHTLIAKEPENKSD